MAREEEIKKALSKPFKSFGGDVNYKMGFEDGVIWANAHPQASKINKEIKNNKTMTREEAKELLPVIKAFADGKEIQYRDSFGEWIDIKKNEGLSFIKSPLDYRTKPESQYRPFKTQEECWNEMLKHQPFGWVKEISSEMLYLINGISDMSIVIMEDINSFKEAMNIYEFKDGTPFGIKEE